MGLIYACGRRKHLDFLSPAGSSWTFPEIIRIWIETVIKLMKSQKDYTCGGIDVAIECLSSVVWSLFILPLIKQTRSSSQATTNKSVFLSVIQ